MSKITLPSFSDYIEKFPEVDLPLMLTPELATSLSTTNNPLPIAFISTFLPYEMVDLDEEIMEFVPFFKLKNSGTIHALIYWKAALMSYEYIMVTYDNKGRYIQNRVLAGQTFEGDTILESVLTIEEDWLMYGVVGKTQEESDADYDASMSKVYEMELLADGEIVDSQ